MYFNYCILQQMPPGVARQFVVLLWTRRGADWRLHGAIRMRTDQKQCSF